MNKISLVIITFNEARNIVRCINSAKDIADEVLVIDSFSKDNTVALATNMGVKVILTEWQGYAETKNYANSLAENDWILSLDADEELSDELKESILKVKEEGLNGTYIFRRLSNYCGHKIYHCGWYPDYKKRLFQRKFCKWTEKFIHESLICPEQNQTQVLKGIINHYSYYTITEHLTRTKKYAHLSAKQSALEKEKGIFLKLFLKPLIKFISAYIYKLGFLDGYYGIIICALQSHGTFLKYYYRMKNELD